MSAPVPPGRAEPPQFPKPRRAAPYLQRMEAARCLGARLTPQPPRKFPDVSAGGRARDPACCRLAASRDAAPGLPLPPAGRWVGEEEEEGEEKGEAAPRGAALSCGRCWRCSKGSGREAGERGARKGPEAGERAGKGGAAESVK